jgi:hypothetical protein
MRSGVAVAWFILMVAAFLLGRVGTAPEAGRAPTGAELQVALDQTSPLDRAAELSRYLEALSPANVDEAAEMIELNQLFFTQPEHLMLMTAWTRFDSEGALDWAVSREGRLQRRATIAVVEAIAYTNPAAARALSEDRNDLSFGDLLHDHLIKGWARSDHLGTLTQHIISIRRSDRRRIATSLLATELLKRGSAGLTGWAESVPEDAPRGFKKLVFQKTADVLSVRDPAEAAAWIQQYVEHDYGQGTLELIARRWAAQSWESALDWLIARPPGEERMEALKRLFSDWLKRRTASAEAWARASAPDDAVDPAIRVIVRRDYWEHSAVSMDWSHLISDHDIRSEVQLGVGRSWYSRDPEAFREWLPQSGLEQRVQDKILASF